MSTGSRFYEFTAKALDGHDVSMETYRGKVVLIVNVASNCGFTPQYEGLERLYERFADRGLVVLGFPCNQFAKQEPGDARQIDEFCRGRFGVRFPMFAKLDVNGSETHPLYRWLKAEKKGFLGTESIKWNFTKFLVGRKGEVLARYAPTDTPDSLVGAVETALGTTAGGEANGHPAELAP